MSAKLMGQVWDLDLPHNEAWVLMALADHADHEGNNVYPGLELLSYKTQYSERQLRRILDSLEATGILIPVNGGIGRGQRQHYRIDMKAAPLKSEKRSKRPVNTQDKSGHFDNEKPGILSGFESRKADILTTEKRTFSTLKADISGFAYKEEPSIEPSEREPSENPVTHSIGAVLLQGAGFTEMQAETLSPMNYSKLEAAITRLTKAQITTAQIQQARKNWWGSKPPTFDQLADEALKVANGNGATAKHDPRTHYSDGREKPKGIRGLVV